MLSICNFKYNTLLSRKEIEETQQKEALNHLAVAFSRDSEEVVYVQHRMVEHGATLCSLLLKEKAVLFICG